MTFKASKCPNLSTAACSLEPLYFLWPSISARVPPFGVDWSVRLSRIAVLGASVRPECRRKSCAMLSKQLARSQRCVCCWTVFQGGRSLGIIRHGQPARTNQRSPLNSSRNGYSRCGASYLIKVRYGPQNAHSASLTSLG